MPAANYNAAVLANGAAGENVMLLTARWDETTPAPACGQFYMLRAWEAEEAPLLSRPISVHRFDREKKEISFLYEVRGTGTQKLAALRPGDTVALTGPSGRGFPVDGTLAAPSRWWAAASHRAAAAACGRACRAGRGRGPLRGLSDEPYRVDAFSAACRSVHIATDSGRHGHHGFVTDLLDPAKYTAVCTCGPEIMMEKVAKMCLRAGVRVYVSREAKMACGVGACLGCTCKSKNGGVSVCKDGPVFEGSVLYELD